MKNISDRDEVVRPGGGIKHRQKEQWWLAEKRSRLLQERGGNDRRCAHPMRMETKQELHCENSSQNGISQSHHYTPRPLLIKPRLIPRRVTTRIQITPNTNPALSFSSLIIPVYHRLTFFLTLPSELAMPYFPARFLAHQSSTAIGPNTLRRTQLRLSPRLEFRLSAERWPEQARSYLHTTPNS